MGTTHKLAQFIVETRYEDIPAAVVHAAKRVMIDTVGVMIAGAQEPASRVIASFVRNLGGNPHARVIGTGCKTSSPNAALANGTMGHALDYDDVSVLGHPTVTLLPAVLALGEEIGTSGKAVLESLVIGFEVWSKLATSGIDPRASGFHPTAVFGTMGAAASASKLLGLDGDQTRMVLGLAASHAGGMGRNRGTMTKPYHAGKAASSGVVAAMLVQNGFTATPDIIEGRFGFYDAFTNGAGNEDWRVTENLGNPYAILSPGVDVKKYPACYYTHRSIDAMLALQERHEITPEDVDEIRCEAGSTLANALVYHEPANYLQGKFSMEFCLATALVERRVGLLQITDEKVNDPKIRELMKRVRVNFEGAPLAEKDVVNVRLKNGKEYSLGIERARGAAEIPLTDEEIIAKYRDSASLLLPQDKAEKVLAQMLNMEQLHKINYIMDILGEGTLESEY
jgi:2-methylcitrate dehydratase PrpD